VRKRRVEVSAHSTLPFDKLRAISKVEWLRAETDCEQAALGL